MSSDNVGKETFKEEVDRSALNALLSGDFDALDKEDEAEKAKQKKDKKDKKDKKEKKETIKDNSTSSNSSKSSVNSGSSSSYIEQQQSQQQNPKATPLTTSTNQQSVPAGQIRVFPVGPPQGGKQLNPLATSSNLPSSSSTTNVNQTMPSPTPSRPLPRAGIPGRPLLPPTPQQQEVFFFFFLKREKILFLGVCYFRFIFSHSCLFY